MKTGPFISSGRLLISAVCWLGLALACTRAAGTSIVAWGDNTYGQTNVPPGLTNTVAIAQGGYHGLALAADGTLSAWGYNSNPAGNYYVGQATPPAGLSNVVAVAAGYDSSLALQSNGSVVFWGDYRETNLPARLNDVVGISTAESHSLALGRDGTVVAWGNNVYGQTNVPPGLSNVVAVVAGGDSSVALLGNGSAVVWGFNGSSETNVPPNATNLVAIAVGLYHILGLKADGTVVGWGYNGYGQTTVPTGLSNVVAIAAGWHHSLALRRDGTVVAWGYNNSGQATVPTGLSNVLAIAACRYQSLALANDGAPWVLTGPTNQTLYSGMNARLTVSALGSAPLSYQWQCGGTNLAGATTSTLVLTNAQSANSGDYAVVITNAAGALLSGTAVLTVLDAPPFLLSLPAYQVVALRSNVTLAVTATGSLPLSYQWQLYGTNLVGATNATLSVTNAPWSAEGPYTVVVSNPFGTGVSTSWFLDVMDVGEALNASNLDWTSPYGSLGWFPETAITHDGVAAVQSGGNGVQHCVLTTSVTGPGTVTFWARATGNFMSFTGTLCAPPGLGLIGSKWQQQTVYVGSGTQTLLWTFTQTPWPGGGTAWVDEVTFTPGGTAVFLSRFTGDQRVLAGSNATFSVVALGTPPFAYQWEFNGSSMPGATTSSLTLTNVQGSNAGTYAVTVTNAYGSARSSSASLAVSGGTILVNDGSFGLSPEGFRFNISAVPGQSIVVETSTNLSDWVPQQTNVVPSAGICLFVDGSPADSPYRFYRVRPWP